jgi:predicted AAA+ superfamily ATPase
MFKREIANELRAAAKEYPVVTVTGPRQSGKTTVVQALFPEKKYANLEEPDTREFATLDPRGFLERFPEGAILDEIQRTPQLLSYIQAIVDKTKQKGMYILTGSHQLELHQAITQSLAGRTALLKLLPLSLTELAKADIDLTLDEYLLNGFFPRIYNDKLNPTKAYRNYFQTYVERDVRQLIQIKDLSTFQRFMKLCAGRVGQILNAHSLSGDVGVSSHTISEWLSLLEASFIIIRLQPYFENFGKRIIKSPKLYFTDVGLATYLLDIETTQQINRDPLRGALVENLVILELYKARLNQGLDPQLYYFRDNHQHEIDVIFKKSQQLIPIEIKASKTIANDFFKGLDYFSELVGTRCHEGFLVYGGEQQQRIEKFKVINYKESYKIVL